MKYINTTFSLLHTIVVGSGLSTLGSTAVLAQSAESRSLAVSSVPAVLDVPADNRPYLRAAAVGTQNYLCMPSGWTFIGPQATLFLPSADHSPIRIQVATHFLSPNPDSNEVPRATWQSSFDTSAVWAVAIASSADAAGPGSIPWLLLQVEGAEQGPMGGSARSGTTYIQRINTSGGASPTTACITGARAFVPYTAEYVFYRKASH